ncbi:S-layer homology domain-containing protein [Paenibacillaceae bacterium WGS1546]|uniref:S-layer homology domain-containing protein n=1 Tax=Cohnella sp. WGS1546 TaxID=3366810 RepID=UPI00372CE95C
MLKIASGGSHSLALLNNGSVTAWGLNSVGQADVPADARSGVVDIAAGGFFSLALKADGSLVAWGMDAYDQLNVPTPDETNKIVAIDSGFSHSLALKDDGTIVAWGSLSNVLEPEEGEGFVSIAAGFNSSLALTSGGSVVAWNKDGLLNVPTEVQGEVTAISAGYSHFLALKSDGSVVAWRSNGLLDVPEAVRSEVVAVSGGYDFSLALKADGSVIAWGGIRDELTNVPEAAQSGVVAIAAGDDQALALKNDGTLVAWGMNYNHEAEVPGRDTLDGLALQEGSFDIPFAPLSTNYTVQVGSSVAIVNVTATLPDMAYADLYINDQPQASGIAAAVPVSGESTVISVKVAPYFMPARTYTITVLKDTASPGVIFDANGNSTSATTASTKVTVMGTENIDGASLQYVWTTSADAPTVGWEAFSNGNVLTRTSGDGRWYLHVRVVDRDGQVVVNAVSNAFVLDNTAPVIRLNGPNPMRVQLNGEFTDPGATASDLQDGDISSAITVTGAVYTHTAGIYKLDYNVKDTAGNAAATVTRNVEVYRVTTGGGGGGGSGPAPSVGRPYIDVNGTPLDPTTIDTAKPSVTLEVSPNRDGMAYVGIPASVLIGIAVKNGGFIIEIKTPYGSYQVPVNVASLIPGLNDLLAGVNLNAEDISFKITLTDKTDNKEIKAALAAGLPEAEVLGAIVDYRMEIVNAKTGQLIGTAGPFSKALTRIIPLPKNITRLPEQWGAFRYNETTRKFEFVPARAVQIDGAWYAMISSYSNSVYVVVENPVSFTDMQNHWGQSFVRLAAAKGLVEGDGGGKYQPDQAVTRAEFTAMLVRELGRGASISGSSAPYGDVQPGAWYYGAVSIAKELGLLGFANGKSFMPDQPLTREEMASMLAAAIKLEKLPINGEFVSLNGYKDIGSVDAALLQDVRMMVKLEIMTGTSAVTFSPKGKTTRAQAAAVLIRKLQALGWMDEL